MIYVSSDWHGCSPNKIKELLAKAEFNDNDFLFVIGDVIDRGEHSAELLKLLIYSTNMELILGNHEAMLLSCSWVFDEITDEAIDSLDSQRMHSLHVWQRNGADATIKSLCAESPDTRADILEYLRDCRLYDSVSTDNNDFLLVHGGLAEYRPDKKISEYAQHDLL